MWLAAAAASSPELPGFLRTLAPVLDHYGYLAVFGLLFLEDFGVPVPGETILIAAAVYAGAGRLSLTAVFVLALVAAVLGDNVGFAIGHFGGRPLVLRIGKYVRFTPERYDRAQRWFISHGGKVIVIARFVEGLRQANGIVAGASRMHWRRFLVFNVIGAVLWVATWTAVGDLAGAHITAVYDAVSKASIYLLAALVLFVTFRIVRHRRRRSS